MTGERIPPRGGSSTAPPEGEREVRIGIVNFSTRPESNGCNDLFNIYAKKSLGLVSQKDFLKDLQDYVDNDCKGVLEIQSGFRLERI